MARNWLKWLRGLEGPAPTPPAQPDPQVEAEVAALPEDELGSKWGSAPSGVVVGDDGSFNTPTFNVKPAGKPDRAFKQVGAPSDVTDEIWADTENAILAAIAKAKSEKRTIGLIVGGTEPGHIELIGLLTLNDLQLALTAATEIVTQQLMGSGPKPRKGKKKA